MLRTTADLVDKIAEDLVWRRRELSDMRWLVDENQGSPRERVLIRSAIALLYAHWEGFVKKVGSYYLDYVASQGLTYRNLSSNFVALSLRSKSKELAASEKVSAANAIAEFFCHQLDTRARLPVKTGIDTRSNLSSTVLLDILDALGLDSEQFATRFSYIDTKIVDPRNHIAHGQDLGVTYADYDELHTSVLGLLETFRNLVENASVLKKYRRG